MFIAKRYKMGDKYSRHLYIMDTINDSRHLETPVLYSTMDSDSPDTEYEVDLTERDATIVRKDGAKIYSGYTSKEILLTFNRIFTNRNKML